MPERERGVENIICSTFEDAQFRANSLPSAGLFDVLEHIERDAGFIRSLYETLQPKGRVYLTVPAHNFLWSKEDSESNHFRRYNLKEISRIFSNAGFKVEYGTYFFSVLTAPIFLARTLPSKFGIYKTDAAACADKADKNIKQKKFVADTRIFDIPLNWEKKRISEKKSIPAGASCLVVARKDK